MDVLMMINQDMSSDRGRANACRCLPHQWHPHRATQTFCVTRAVCVVLITCCYGCDATWVVAVTDSQMDAHADTTAQATATTALATSTVQSTRTSRDISQNATSTTTMGTTAAATTTATTTTTTSTTTTAFAGCGGVTRCLAHTNCTQCLDAINATIGFPHTNAAFTSLDRAAERAYGVGFFRALQSTASCSTSATPPGVLYPALQELNNVPSCFDAVGMVVGPCLVIEYACFVDPDCRQCFSALLAAADDNGSNGSKTSAFRSPACVATRYALFIDLQQSCRTFPTCTFVKQQCDYLPECGECLATLGGGDGAGAARQCRGSTRPSAVALDGVVNNCIDSNAAACDFWRQRCTDNAVCGACLADMGSGGSLRAIASDWSSPACQLAIANDYLAIHYLQVIAAGCPAISTCRQIVADCVLNYGDVCVLCINGSALQPREAAMCSTVLQVFPLDAKCQPCPASVHTINAVVFATATVGGASAAACIVVTTAIVAHGHDRVSMRDRIVIGLMMANAVYSTANAIPINALRTGVFDCGRLAMSFYAIRFGRAWWFCGKYGLVGFELFILGASIRALYRGMAPVPARAEAAMHAACCSLAALAFAVFYALCFRINTDGYNARVESEAYSNARNDANANDDLDDESPSVAASLTFESERDAYDNLVRDMLVAWDVIVGVAIGLWIVLRAVHLHALRTLRTEAAVTVRAEASDVWRDTRRSAWKTRRRLLEARQEAFNEVAKPLEPYIFVFVAFAAPAFVMSTAFCQDHSGARALGGADSVGDASSDFTYGTCDVWCEFALAFRSLGTVAVYLVSRERRTELVAVRSTWRKLCLRVLGCILCASSPYATLDHGPGGEYELDELGQPLATIKPNSDSAVADSVTTTSVSSSLISESSIIKVRQLGKGAFGGVWEGRLLPENKPVAIKILFAGAVDEDGDAVDLNADEDFRKECEALQRVNSLYLIKFFGFGTTAEGNGFIVTELLHGGSLESALHNSELDIPWHLRVTFGMHVAHGMEHLHQLHMLHRDLKSANVLVNEQHTIAKVCDFGLARVVRPARRHVMLRSPFTGVIRLLPSIDGVDFMNDKPSALPMDHTTTNVMDTRGIMTKGAGTPRWMAPEVFRGDQNYTEAVDVYSFGIVLWELATRTVPWDGELSRDELELFAQLNRALQLGRRPTVSDAVRTEHGAFVAVMERCWTGDPVNRPTFSEAARDLAACLRTYA